MTAELQPHGAATLDWVDWVDSEDCQLLEHLAFVRKNSGYYKTLWQDVSNKLDNVGLSQYPMVDHTSFWAANSLSQNRVLTSPQADGIILQTGGTTNSPKLSFWSNAELKEVADGLAACLDRCDVQRGDRVANLFYAGDMYGSFLLHVLSVYHLGKGIQIPICGHVALSSMIHFITETRATVILGTITTLCRLSEQLRASEKTLDSVRLFLYSGEALYDDQIGGIRAAFPSIQVKSLIYGTIDSGTIGLNARYSDQRVHEVMPGMVIEIVTDDGHVTTEPGVPGDLIVTNLKRRLMPIVRYPCGDRAAWVDVNRKTFRLLERSGFSVRVGPVSFDFVHLRACVVSAIGPSKVTAIQAVIARANAKDQLTLRVATVSLLSPEEIEAAGRSIIAQVGEARPMFQEHVEKQLINPLKVEFGSLGDLSVSKRTGKLAEVVDLRTSK